MIVLSVYAYNNSKAILNVKLSLMHSIATVRLINSHTKTETGWASRDVIQGIIPENTTVVPHHLILVLQNRCIDLLLDNGQSYSY